MKDLTATLRLQFHRGFTLDDATALVDYFAELGISHIYASPLLTARPGSMHGYDVIDPTRINPELGGEPALQRLVEALRAKGMGLILDIVSNHMAVGGAGNAWWLDVLEWAAAAPMRSSSTLNGIRRIRCSKASSSCLFLAATTARRCNRAR